MIKTSSLYHFEAYEYLIQICEDQLSTHNQTKSHGGLKITVSVENSLDAPLCTIEPILLKMHKNVKKGYIFLNNNDRYP